MPRHIAALCGAWFDEIRLVASVPAVAIAPAAVLLRAGHCAILRVASRFSGAVLKHRALASPRAPRRGLNGGCDEFLRPPFLGTPCKLPPKIRQYEEWLG